jgi:mTERF
MSTEHGIYYNKIDFTMLRSSSNSHNFQSLSLSCDNHTTAYTEQYCIEYSFVFHRHVVRHVSNDSLEDEVVESFLWLDDAKVKYPSAIALPPVLRADMVIGYGGAGIATVNDFVLSCSEPECSAGNSSMADCSSVLQSVLNWTSAQVYQFEERWPPLRTYPVSQLRIRLRFLLAPLPPDDILRQANVTDDLDWPTLFYVHRYGAGLTIPQISIALQMLPDPSLLLRWNFNSTDSSDKKESILPKLDGCNENLRPAGSNVVLPDTKVYTMALATLYDQTPPAVVQITMSTLHLWVTGVSQVDVISLAYLHWRGWNWPSCRVVLHAFRSSLLCHLEPPSWQEEQSTFVRTRTTMLAESFAYLQIRLQLRPWHVRAMLKTHSRLSGYTQAKLQHNLDFLQERLQMRSSDLQALVLQMPSLLGAATNKLEERVRFWIDRVGLTMPQLRSAVLRKSALLQYSLEKNLEAKLSYFREDLCLNHISLCQLTKTHPEVWARSLDTFFWPMTRFICSKCGNMTLTEFGQIVAQVPELFLYSIYNIERKLNFLRDRLGLGDEELKGLVLSTPRILKQSISSSLQVKIECIEAANSSHENIREIVSRNPSLLTLSKGGIEKRLLRGKNFLSTMPLSLALQESAKKRRPSKAVWLMERHNESEAVELEFSDVAAAALHAETTKSNIYSALRLGRLVNGRKYIYASNGKQFATSNDVVTTPSLSIQAEILPSVNTSLDDDPDTSSLCIYTVGRAFPPEDTVRGRKRAGGIALQIRNWSTKEWGQTCSTLWKGLRLRLLPDSRTLIVGYPYTRPSRPRCSLYACREALRVAKEWLPLVSTPNVNITIACESNYALNLLHNTTRLYEWGTAGSREEFCFIGPGALHKANPDILYPLARSYYALVEQVAESSGERKKVSISFVSSDSSDFSRRLRDGAKLAATLMYESIR